MPQLSDLNALRFDDTSTRKVRRYTNKAAGVSKTFDPVITNLEKLITNNTYSNSEHTTIAEVLVPIEEGVFLSLYNKAVLHCHV